MLVLDFHGFYDTARRERREDRLAFFVDKWQLDVVVAEPHGSGDAYSGDSRAWNVDGNGLNTEPGPRGPTCLAPRYNGDGWNDRYKCYDSCAGCDSTWGCNFASCMDDRSLVASLFRRLSATLCLDLEAIHLTGISAGGLMAYQAALDFSDLVASAAPVAGSRIWGYNRAPRHPVSLLDLHGFDDVYVPANASNGFGGAPDGATTSHDRFFYHEVPAITRQFARAAGCNLTANRPHPTKFDGLRRLSCNEPHGACASGASVVQCVGEWGHTWPLHHLHPFAYADLVLGFFSRHPKARGVHGAAFPPAWLLGEDAGEGQGEGEGAAVRAVQR
mmetsp:Transcript_34566/g.114498  ORF Transcript_34566/g.114498 Transcript_34566/m.114498 type:complete len:331 (-) Transcript_34566:87-1079(-)